VALTPALAQQFVEAVRFSLLHVDDHVTFIEAETPRNSSEVRRGASGASRTSANGGRDPGRSGCSRQVKSQHYTRLCAGVRCSPRWAGYSGKLALCGDQPTTNEQHVHDG
jgi:hypothetical protein